jgi:acyl carrier protein
MKTTLEAVQEILEKKFSLPTEALHAEATLESLKLDSLDLIETLFEVEDEFQIRIPQDQGDGVKMTTIQDIVDVINRLVAQQQPAQLAGGYRS